MTARSAYQTSVIQAQQTQASADAAAAMTLQVAISAQTQGARPLSAADRLQEMFGVSQAQANSIKTAQQTAATTVTADLAAYNASVDAAKQTLKATGDTGPV